MAKKKVAKKSTKKATNATKSSKAKSTVAVTPAKESAPESTKTENNNSGKTCSEKPSMWKNIAYIAALVLVAIVLFLIFKPSNVDGDTVVPDDIAAKGDVAVDGSNVAVWYAGHADGVYFDTNIESVAIEHNLEKPAYQTLDFTIGSGAMIKGFNDGVIGMKVGETKEITIEPEDAYGAYQAELVRSIPMAEFTQAFPEVTPEIGLTFAVRGPQGQALPVRITNMGSDFVTLDLNHELAGKKLTFEITLDSIKE